MIILVLRTDKPEAELYVYEDQKKLAETKWQAHRQLAETMHKEIRKILNRSSNSWEQVEAIVCYGGPGSFTGLRIGLSVANALAYARQIPIVAKSGSKWLEDGITAILDGQDDEVATPKYGGPAHVTKPRK